MSVSNSRHSLLAYFSSKSMGKRFRSRIAAVARSAKRRSLRMEALERRELMASDVGNSLHNALVPTDVNGDFDITPIDVLQVINAINRQSRNTSTSSSLDDSSDRQPMVDVNADGDISPIDALMVINHLRTGEGVGELAEVGVQVLNASGTVLTPQIGAGNVPEYRIAPGEKFSVRTQTRDIRPSPEGVFSSYVDINYAAQGSATTELVEVQWGEVQTLSFSRDTNGGTFSLRYGTETTTPITYSTNLATTRNAIANAIGALSFVGGTSNVRVVQNAQPTAPSTEGPFFDIFFVGSLIRQNVTDVEVASSNLTVVGGGAGQLNVSSVANPANKLSLSSAVSYPINPAANGNTFSYGTLPFEGTLASSPTGFKIDNGGGALGGQPTLDDAGVFANVFDTAFRASNTPGIVDFSVGPSGTSRLTVLLFGSDEPLTDQTITFPQPFRVIIASDLFAANDTFALANLTSPQNFVVGGNDIFGTGTTATIVGITQPSSGGSVAIVTGSTNTAAAVTFTPSSSFVGPATFTYTLENNNGARSTATVTVNGPNLPPERLGTSLNAVEAGATVSFTSDQLFSPGAGETSQTVRLRQLRTISGDGSFSLVDESNSFTYTPPSNDFFGPVVFSVIGIDNGSPEAQTPATFTINVADVNDPPVVRSSSVNATEDIAVTIRASDLFLPGPTSESATQTVRLTSATAVSGQTGGTISIDSSGDARFVPTAEFSGTFLFTAVAQDNGSPAISSVESTFTINIAEVNDDPIARPDTGSARFVVPRISTQTKDLLVLANDTSGDAGQTIRVTSIDSLPASGTLVIGPNGANVQYTPAANTPISSVQTFRYTISDGEKTSSADAEIFIAPETLPFAADDTVQVAANSTQPITIRVLDNDLSNDGATSRLDAIVNQLNPSSAGTLAQQNDGTILFTPAAGFTGTTASFTYRMTDSAAGSQPSVGTVTINFGELNDPPVVTRTTPIAGTEDTPQTIVASTLFAPGPADEASQTLVITDAAAVSGQTGGTISVVNDEIRFVPTENFFGSFAFVATARDNGTTNGQSDFKSTTGTFTISVVSVNDAPTASFSTRLTAEDTTLTMPANSIFVPGPANESSQTLTFTNAVAVSSQTDGMIEVINGNAVFTPAQNFVGAFAFVGTVQDNGSPSPSSQSATITITVTPVNDAPVPVAATRSANATIATTFDLSAELAQASRGGGPDEAGQTVRITSVRKLTTNGNTVSRNSDGTISYLAAAGFSGPDTIEYTIADNGDPEATGVAILTVNVAAFVPSSVSGQVWIDDDQDSTQDSDELRLGGVEMTLTGRAVGATADITPIRKITRTDGSYTFDGLSPGNYIVTFTPPTKLVDAPAPNSIALNIAAPGGVNAVQNFSVYGFETGYNHLLDNLESNYYLRNGQQWRQRGLTSLVLPNGTSAWTAHHGGFEGFQSESLRVAADGVYLRVVQANSSVLETKLPRDMYISCNDGNGNTLVRVFATPANLSFAPVINSAEGENHASNVDYFFSQMGS